jgi:hypothetical protein
MLMEAGTEGETAVWLYPSFTLAMDGGVWLKRALPQGTDPVTTVVPPVSMCNNFQHLPRLCETVDNIKH